MSRLTPDDLDRDFVEVHLSDFGVWVTVYPFDLTTGAVGTTGTKCQALPRPIRTRLVMAPDGGAVAVSERRWHLRAYQLTGITLTEGAEIAEADGTRWAVESHELMGFGTRSVCETHKV